MVIEIKDLRKEYGDLAALDGVSFGCEEGRVLGFLGPNGAGKTTAIRILLGLLKATGGECRVFGKDCWRDGESIRNEVGYLPGEPRFYVRLTGNSLLSFLAEARKRECRSEIKRLAERFDLDLTRRIREYSSGMKQKLGLIQALMHRPNLVVLDEPTNALDPLVRQSLFGELEEVRKQGRTVLFSSHTLAEVEQVCDDVVLLRDGLVVESSPVESLRSKASRRVAIQFVKPPTDAPAELHLQQSDRLNWQGVWSGDANALLRWLAQQEIEEVDIGPPKLEDLFLTYYASTSGGEA